MPPQSDSGPRPDPDRPLLGALLVEDDPGDVLIAQEALREGKLNSRLTVVSDGVEAMAPSTSAGSSTSYARSTTSYSPWRDCHLAAEWRDCQRAERSVRTARTGGKSLP